MRPFVTAVTEFVLLLNTLIVAGTVEGAAQGRSEEDTMSFNHGLSTHQIEVGFNPLGAGLAYRYQWFSFFSTDVVASPERPGIAAGLTFSPLWMFFVQGIVGKGSYEEAIALDGPPPFKPTYLYGWNAGVHFPIAPKKTRLYFIFAIGQIHFVQNHYNFNGGGFLVGPPPPPLYKTEFRGIETYVVGLGLSL